MDPNAVVVVTDFWVVYRPDGSMEAVWRVAGGRWHLTPYEPVDEDEGEQV
jgi:hypothetical protein